MIKKHPVRAISLIFFVIFCALSNFVYFMLDNGSVNSLIEQMLHREQVIVRSGAKTISGFIDLSSKSLLALANQDEVTDHELKDFIDNFSNTPITGVIRTNQQGEIVSAFSNIEKLSSGGNVSDRDYFQSAKSNPNQKIIFGKSIVSRATGASQDYKIPIVTPVVKNGQFKGVITISISVPLLTNHYLDSLKISDQTDIILIDKDGYFLSSHHPEVVGQSIAGYIEKNPFLGDKLIFPTIQQKLQETDEQKLDLVIPNLTSGKLTRTLIASTPINFDNNKWFLVITTPVDDALAFVSPFILKNILGIFISFFVSIFITLYLFNRFIKN